MPDHMYMPKVTHTIHTLELLKAVTEAVKLRQAPVMEWGEFMNPSDALAEL